MTAKTVVRNLYVPDLTELANVIQNGLKDHYKQAVVSLCQCPDLTQTPYDLASPGFGGHTAIADIGGVLNMEFLANNNKFHYDLKGISKETNLPFFIGAGATKPDVAFNKDNSEWMPNANVATGMLLSKEAYVNKDGNCCLLDYPSHEFSSLCNLFGSEGQPNTQVLKITASIRTGPLNIVSCIRQTIQKHYGTKQVGLGGVLLIKKGKIKSHVMPGFPPCDVFEKDIQWLKFFQVSAPITCLSVLVSNDTHGDGLRLEHTHFFTKGNDGGHYHYDVTPEEVEYEGYFAPAQMLYRIARDSKPMVAKQ